MTDVTGVAAPRLDGNSLVLRPRCLKIRGIATPACALVRNDRAFSNSPNYFQEVISCLIEGTDSAMLFDSGMGIDMHYGHDCYPFEGFSIVLSGYP